MQALEEQFRFLVSSALAYDNGNRSEAKRLSLTIRLLVHRTRFQNPLLNQLDVLYRMRFVNSAKAFSPGNLLPESPLTLMQHTNITRDSSSNVTFIPRFDENPVTGKLSTCPFSNWWGQDILEDASKCRFKRRTLVLTMADQDGGAHIDGEIDLLYSRLSEGKSSGWGYTQSDGATVSVPDQLVAAIRQIAHEVIRSLESQFSKLQGIYPSDIKPYRT